MRALNRNKRLLHYALLLDEVENTNEYGFETGEVTPIYSDAVPMYCNISGAMGEEIARAFGNLANYSRTVFVADNDCPMDEHSIVWFGVTPTEPHNYIVVGRADSKNGVLYALREVNVG